VTYGLLQLVPIDVVVPLGLLATAAWVLFFVQRQRGEADVVMPALRPATRGRTEQPAPPGAAR
jgi:hypothetical protein